MSEADESYKPVGETPQRVLHRIIHREGDGTTQRVLRRIIHREGDVVQSFAQRKKEQMPSLCQTAGGERE